MISHALLLAAAIALAAPPQSGLGIAVTPAKIDTILHPGVVSTIPVTVRNDHDHPVHVIVTPADFRLDEHGAYVYSAPGARSMSLARWLEIKPREFDVPAESFQEVVLSVAAPNAPLSGEYAGVMLVQTRPVRGARAALAFSARYALKVYGVAEGTVKRGAEISKVRALATPDGERYRVTFHNAGNTHVYVNGRLDVLRGGEHVASYALPPQQLLERESQRTFEFVGSTLPHGSYEAVAVFDDGGAERIGGRVRFDA